MRDPQPEFPRHTHNFDELVIILEGTARHVVDQQEFPVRSGDVFVVAGDHEHQYLDMKRLVLCNILFDTQALVMDQWDIRTLPGFHALFALEPLLRTQQKFNSRLRLTERQLHHAQDLINDLIHETQARNPGYRVMVRGFFMQLAVFLSRCYTEQPSEASIDLLRLGDAIAYIDTHYTKKITLQELAAKAHLSTRHFLRIFQDCMGRSPIDYLMHVRVQKATELLRNTTYPVTQIAYSCGFYDSNYFTRVFRKFMNVSPTDFRSKRASLV